MGSMMRRFWDTFSKNIMKTVGKDAQPVASRNQEVELSHFLLLRMCRVMDLWCLGGGMSPWNGSPAWFTLALSTDFDVF